MFDFIIVTLALVALGPINIPVKALRVHFIAYVGGLYRESLGKGKEAKDGE
jgi:hypothetical protein